MKNLVLYIRHGQSTCSINSLRETDSNEILHNNKHKPLNEEQQKMFDSILNPRLTGKGIEQAIKTAKTLIKCTKHTLSYFIEECDRQNIKYDLLIVEELKEYDRINKQTFKSFFDQVTRFNDFLKEQLKDNKTIFIFGHSQFFSTLLAYHIHNEQNALNNFPSIKLPNCSISAESYNFDKGLWETLFISSLSHLPNELITGSRFIN